MASSLARPPALRITWASPSLRPANLAGSSRASMQVRIAKRRAGGKGSLPLSPKSPAEVSFAARTSVRTFVMTRSSRWIRISASGPRARVRRSSSARSVAEAVTAREQLIGAGGARQGQDRLVQALAVYRFHAPGMTGGLQAHGLVGFLHMLHAAGFVALLHL